MTTEPVPKLVVSLAVPTIISMLVTSFYNMVDTYFVGGINTSATAAVGVVFSLMAVIQAIGFLYGHGSGTLMARKLGEQKEEEASKIANTAFYTAMLTGIVVMVLGLLGHASMWLAVFADSGVAMLCVLNSIRMLYKK